MSQPLESIDLLQEQSPLTSELDHLQQGFAHYSEAKVPFRRLHAHDGIEVSVNEHHPVVALFGADRVVLPPNYLVVFWATRPHGPIETTPGGWAHGLHLPLPWVLQWQLPSVLIRSLLAGEVLLDAPRRNTTADLDQVKDWVRLLRYEGEESRRIVLLEVEARLRRLAMALPVHPLKTSPAGELQRHSPNAAGRFEKMAALIARHFEESLSIGDIAAAVSMAPAAAMRLFRKFSGMTLHQYLLQHRVSHAQRLLATTNATIETIAAKSGFGSAARFYACFRESVGQSPAAYRRALQDRGNPGLDRKESSTSGHGQRRRIV